MNDGYNNDIVFNGVRYHVQTENQRAPQREIVSHVYQGGAILLTVRRPFRDQADDPDGTLPTQDMTTKQHQDILQAIQRGGMNLARAYRAKYVSGR